MPGVGLQYTYSIDPQSWKEKILLSMAFFILPLLSLDLEGRCLIFNII